MRTQSRVNEQEHGGQKVDPRLPLSPILAPRIWEDLNMDELNHADQLRLLKFVCSFAWADLEIRPEERAFVEHLVRTIGLNDEERTEVEGWLQAPPRPESIDPTSIPANQRKLFLTTIDALIRSDGEISPEERENFDLLKDLLDSALH
jgi:uncharacterized membrane protein YebE (DUF533 family)